MKAMEKILRGAEKGAEWIVLLLLSLMVVNVGVGVFFRYVLQNSISWVEELGRYMMIWSALLGCGLAMSEDRHVGVSMFVEQFPEAAQRVFRLAKRIVTMAFLAVVLVKAFEHLKTLNIQMSSAMEIPMVIPYAAVPVGALFMLAENLALALRDFAQHPTKQ